METKKIAFLRYLEDGVILTREEMKQIVGGATCSVTCKNGREARHSCGSGVTCVSNSSDRSVSCGAGEKGYGNSTTHYPCTVNTKK